MLLFLFPELDSPTFNIIKVTQIKKKRDSIEGYKIKVSAVATFNHLFLVLLVESPLTQGDRSANRSPQQTWPAACLCAQVSQSAAMSVFIVCGCCALAPPRWSAYA